MKTKDGDRGSALLLDGRLVHLVLHPDDPFEYGLYSTALTPVDPEDADTGEDDETPGVSELDRRAGSGARLTEAEKRLLERLRNRPGIR